MNLRVLSLAALSLVVPMSVALANPLAGGPNEMSSGFVPRVPVSAFARPASWLDPSRLGVTASFTVGSGFGTGTNALQVTTLSYRFNAPLWMSVSLGNAMGSTSPRGNSFFLQGFEAAYRPFPSLQINVQYQNVQSPLQYQGRDGLLALEPLKPSPGASRLGNAFTSHAGSPGLIPFLTAGFPSPETCLELMNRLERAGAMALEIGIPFSDPIADGPDIQRASESALREGIGPLETLDLVRRYRSSGALPVVLMTYANPVLRIGADAFAGRARESGADAVILTDVPPDEFPELWGAFDRAHLDTVVLVAPTTPEERLPILIERCRGFVYCLSRTGVTGGSEGYAGSLDERLDAIRRHTRLPLGLGFGISSGEQAKRLRKRVDAVVVGAAFTRAIAIDPRIGAGDRVEALAGELVAALR